MAEWLTPCANGSCLEVKLEDPFVKVRDSKTGIMLIFTHTEWIAHLAAVRRGDYDLSGPAADVTADAGTLRWSDGSRHVINCHCGPHASGSWVWDDMCREMNK